MADSRQNTSEEYKRELLKALEFLKSKTTTLERARSKFGVIYMALKNYDRRQNWELYPDVEFDLSTSKDPHQNILFDNNRACLRIYGEIKAKNGKVLCHKIQMEVIYRNRYSDIQLCSCCIKNGTDVTDRVVRKFHFDFEAGTILSDHPVYHLQYGGERHPDVGVKVHYCLEPKLKLPRIPAIPFSFLSILDLGMKEFAICKEITEDAFWKSVVKESETTLALPFIDKLNKEINNKSGTIREIYVTTQL